MLLSANACTSSTPPFIPFYQIIPTLIYHPLLFLYPFPPPSLLSSLSSHSSPSLPPYLSLPLSPPPSILILFPSTPSLSLTPPLPPPYPSLPLPFSFPPYLSFSIPSLSPLPFPPSLPLSPTFPSLPPSPFPSLPPSFPHLKIVMRDLVVCWLKVLEALSRSPVSRAACR